MTKAEWYSIPGHNDYYLAVNLAALELAREYGNNWTWVQCAQQANCSSSTARKYYDSYFRVPEWYSQEQLAAAAQNERILKEKQQIEKTGATVQLVNAIHINPTDLPIYCKNSLTFHTVNNISDKPGIYLLGQTSYNPDKNEIWYFLKVGKAVNLQRRLKDYNTHNPTYFIFATQHGTSATIDQLEIQWQNQIENRGGWHMGDNAEWFIVSPALFNLAKKYGFSGLRRPL